MYSKIKERVLRKDAEIASPLLRHCGEACHLAGSLFLWSAKCKICGTIKLYSFRQKAAKIDFSLWGHLAQLS
jgi:hypothetical protein